MILRGPRPLVELLALPLAAMALLWVVLGIAAALTSGCASIVAIPDTPDWDCAVISNFMSGPEFPVIQLNVAQCRPYFGASEITQINVLPPCSLDEEGIITCKPSVHAVAEMLRQHHLGAQRGGKR